MKKLKLLTMIAAIFLFCGMVNVNAATVDSEQADARGQVYVGTPGTNVEVTKEEDGTFNVKLTGNAVQDIIIYEGEDVTLDLNGYTLTNFTPECEAIKVLYGGKLTIMDSSEEGTGTVTQAATSKFSAITNQGTMIIESGNFITTLSQYVVRNENNLTINGGTFTNESSDTSLIGNIVNMDKSVPEDVKPTMLINEGSYTANSNTVINNENCVVEIAGGTFTSENAYALDNWSEATVSGGKLTSINNSAIRYGDRGQSESVSLTITGGTIVSYETADDIKIVDENAVLDVRGNLSITGGSFTSDVSEYLPSDLELVDDGNGNLVVAEKEVQEEETVPTETPVENPDTSDINLVFIISLIVLATAGLTYTLRKRKFN
mgnify:FL=1